jgi:hypothetical protein
MPSKHSTSHRRPDVVGAPLFATMYDGLGERLNLVGGLRELSQALGGT